MKKSMSFLLVLCACTALNHEDAVDFDKLNDVNFVYGNRKYEEGDVTCIRDILDYKIEKTFDLCQKNWNFALCSKEFPEEIVQLSLEYLGAYRGHFLLFERMSGKGSARFDIISLCSAKKGYVQVYKSIYVGDRAAGGVVSTPIFDGSHSLYFRACLDMSTIAELAGITDTASQYFNRSQEYWNVCSCVYDLKTDELRIINMVIQPDLAEGKNKAVLDKCLDKKNRRVLYLNEKQVSNFLKKFEKYAAKNVAVDDAH